MALTVDVNGVPIQYPQTGDVGWGDNATKFAEEVASVLGKIGQSQAPVNDDIIVSPGNLSVTSGNLSVGGDASVNGNTTLTGNITVNGNSTLGNGTSDTIAITGILNVDSGVLYVDPTTNKVGINTATPTVALDVVGSAAISGTLTAGTFAPTDLTVDTNLIKTNSTDNYVGINTTTPTEALDVTGKILVSSDITVGGVIVADDSTNVTTAPPITFTGDTNTGIGHSAADTLDFVTGGQARFRIEPTGQIKAVYESTIGTDYNAQLDNGYLCRAWVNFNGTLVVNPGTSTGIRASGNVSSITDNGTGNYTINFATHLPDVNYCVTASVSSSAPTSTNNANHLNINSSSYLSDKFTIGILRDNGGGVNDTDPSIIGIGVFR